MSNRLLDAFNGRPQKLDYELKHGGKYEMQDTSNNAPSSPCKYDVERKAYLADKFNIKGSLEFCGTLGRRLEQRTLDEHCNEVESQRRIQNGEKLKVATANWKNHAPVKIWFSVGR